MAEIEEQMGIDLRGRVKSLKLAERNALLPLFEAVVNSIHAIEDSGNTKGNIVIEIEREPSFFGEDESQLPYITGFKIRDNGVGFDDVNYGSFKKAFTTLKENRGSKGIGRFLWLKAFTDVKITSVTSNDGETFFAREFHFNQNTENGIAEHSLLPVDIPSERTTSVHLRHYHDRYKQRCPKKIQTVSKRIIEHCIVYLLQDNCPTILINDDSETINLNDLFKELISGNQIIKELKVEEYQFKLTILKWYEHEEINSNQLRLCAHHRDVEEINLKSVFPDLSGKIRDDSNGEEYFIVAYLEGQYLDDNVNDERTEIVFAKDNLFDSELMPKGLLVESVKEVINELFGKEIKSFTDKKIQYITEFVDQKAPQYKYLLKHQDYLTEIPISESMNDQEVELKLYRAQQQFEFDSKEEIGNLITEIEADDLISDIQQKYDAIIEKVSELNKSKLATYVIHRKVIIQVLEKTLMLGDEGKYELEKTVHSLVFPMRTTSDEIDYVKQNLWIIDERLSYHTFLSSDKPLNSVPGLQTEETARPDLFIFNNPFSFAEGETPFNSIVLVEFKRPMRNTYDDLEENPINQVYEYVKRIRAGKEIMKNGRQYSINEHTRFYIYLICDITSKIQDIAEFAGLERTFDGMGYFGYNKPLKCIVEVMPFDQVVANAKKRNAALFDHLGIA